MTRLEKFLWSLTAIIFVSGLFGFWFIFKKVWPALKPILSTPALNLVRQIPTAPPDGLTAPLATPPEIATSPLKIPPGFSLNILAKDLPGARVLALGPNNTLWVSQPKLGQISVIELNADAVKDQRVVLTGLRQPHGLAFDPAEPAMLYFAEEDKLSRFDTSQSQPAVKIVDLPKGGGHFTRTVNFGPDDRLYVSIGSSCNVCQEADPRRATVQSLNKDGSDFKEFAKGLRNTVFFTWSPVDGRMWGADMGRDNLGDNLPPDEINILVEGKNYGWPICYGKNVHDTNFDKNTYLRNPCQEPFETESFIELPAHSAPLGLAFVPEEGWPEDYWHDLLVAFHGSWNRSQPTGYQVTRMKLDALGNFEGFEDFITGWLTENDQSYGRPVDLLIFPGGRLYISDDKAGLIYLVTRTET